MKNIFLGLIFILIGFASPFILEAVFPQFYYSLLVSFFCFAAGFLFILKPQNYDNQFRPYLKWAQYAILVNIILTILLFFYFSRNREGMLLDIMFNVSFITYPVQTIFNKLVPWPSERLPNGNVIFYHDYTRSLLTDYFNLVFYSIAGMLMKILKDKMVILNARRK